MSAGTIRGRRFVFALMFAAAAITWQSSWAGEPSLRRWPDRFPTPQLSAIDPDGRQWDIHSLRGKVVVLNFWASWCAPCVDEIPFLNDLAHSASMAEEVVVLGVNFKESASTVQRFAAEHRFDYPILLDKSGEHFKKWTNGILPTTVLIDRHGRARWRVVGELDRKDGSVKQAIEKMLEERMPAKAK
ncbi:TlpA disulfide reductase family protein [Noviherbaspirillum sp.]|jgi:thiol-disulfide isomerase/thioredoxin|uniref:TlpA family protein disulfide reductase n=1 Tax=Noviherbaspirillum sp. TaxID=1926288 RepID=UPI0025D4E398|nr:TlpA disulfide reductase family protein [Noviherbaspirillum sp.]